MFLTLLLLFLSEVVVGVVLGEVIAFIVVLVLKKEDHFFELLSNTLIRNKCLFPLSTTKKYKINIERNIWKRKVV